MKARLVFALLLAFIPGLAAALGPHEVLVLVNRNSTRSVDVAGEFVKLRRVPEENVVFLDIPDSALNPAPAISAADFTTYIWAPAAKAISLRGIGDHILAWVYSVDFPVRIETSPPVSILGLTFLRNRLPDPEKVKDGMYQSPLYAGPDNPETRGFPSQSFDVLSAWLGEDMPLPSMMLGFAGERGNSVDDIRECMRRGAAADGTAPTGTVYFITGGDVRATSRSWLFPAARQELAAAGVSAVITDTVPLGKTDILGILMGSADVDPSRFGRFIPGCIADHMTSAAAAFDSANQTKLTAWIKAGATASAGTVTEPFSIWTKFPSARVYVHYAAGCTVMESLFQSVRCPLQILFVGEPLASPWAPRGVMTLHGLDGGPVSGAVSVRAEASSMARHAPSMSGRRYTRYVYLLDGKKTGAQDNSVIELDTTAVADGPHTLRAVAYGPGPVRSQVFAEKNFVVRNRPR